MEARFANVETFAGFVQAVASILPLGNGADSCGNVQFHPQNGINASILDPSRTILVCAKIPVEAMESYRCEDTVVLGLPFHLIHSCLKHARKRSKDAALSLDITPPKLGMTITSDGGDSTVYRIHTLDITSDLLEPMEYPMAKLTFSHAVLKNALDGADIEADAVAIRLAGRSLAVVVKSLTGERSGTYTPEAASIPSRWSGSNSKLSCRNVLLVMRDWLPKKVQLCMGTGDKMPVLFHYDSGAWVVDYYVAGCIQDDE